MNVAIVAVMQAIAGALGGGFVAGAIDDFGGRILSNLVVGGIGSFLLNGQIPALVNGGGEPNIDASGGDDLAVARFGRPHCRWSTRADLQPSRPV